MAAVLMFRDGDTGELTIQASDQPDWMAESLWVAVAAIQRGQAVIVMDDEVDAVGDELALQAPAQEPAMVWLLTPLVGEDGEPEGAISGAAPWLVIILLTCAGLGALTVLGALLWLVWRAVTA